MLARRALARAKYDETGLFLDTVVSQLNQIRLFRGVLPSYPQFLWISMGIFPFKPRPAAGGTGLPKMLVGSIV
jgi:hypothetical protein